MSAISSQDIISILKEEIENYDFEAKMCIRDSRKAGKIAENRNKKVHNQEIIC